MTHIPHADHSEHPGARPLRAAAVKAVWPVLTAAGHLVGVGAARTLAGLSSVCRAFEMVYIDPYAPPGRSQDRTDRSRR